MIIAFVGVSGALGNQLVGRNSELDLALRLLDGSGGVLFAGPQGVGKSSMARAVATAATATGRQLLRLRATAGEPPIPFGAFAPVIPELGAKPGRSIDLLVVLQSLRATLARRAAGHPLILMVDDAHHLDGPSADLLLQLVAEGVVRVVATVDSDATSPVSVRDLWKDELVGRVELLPLGAEATAEMVSHLLALEIGESGTQIVLADRRPGIGLTPPAASPGGDVSDAVWRLSRGFPLYARELVKEGCRTGSIALREGVWRLDSELELGPRLTDLLTEKLRPLTSAESKALELVAIAEPIPFTALLRLVRGSDLEALERKNLATLLVAGGEQVVCAAHPVIGSMVRHSLPAARAAGARLRLAAALEADGRTETELVRIVLWRLDGGANPPAQLLVRASLQASARQEWQAAGRLAEAAVSREGGCEAVLALADAYRAVGRHAEAMDVLADERGESDDQAARAAVVRSSVLFFGFGRLSDALDVLTTALDGVDDLSDRAWLRATRAGFIGLSGRPADAVEQAEKLLAEPGLRPRAELTARAVLSIGLSYTGRTERALEVLQGFRPGPEAVADLPTWSLTARMLAYRQNGQLDQLERFARASYELGLEHHDPRLIGPAAHALGWAELARARLYRAVGWFRESAVALRAAGTPTLRAPALLGLTEALALTGDVEGSRAALEEALRATDHGALFHPVWSVTAAWLSAAQGAVSEALDRLKEAAAEAAAAGQIVSEIHALHSAVRLGSPAPAGRLAELAGWVEGDLIQIVADHGAALERTDRLGDSLDAVADKYAELGLNLFAAEAAAQASRAHEASGRTRRAAASAARGHFLLGAPQEVGRPPLGLALALSPPELTRRESEVAMLAAGGLPSQTIANRLCLSVRTVDTHLARVYVKLGIKGRSELSGALASGASRPQGARAG